MGRSDPLSRRTTLGLAVGAAASALLAGCGGPGEREQEGEDPETADEDDGAGAAAGEWADVDEIFLEAQEGGWTVSEPGFVEDTENPTLVFHVGQEYEITWENADGLDHSFVVGGEDEVEIESTEVVDEEGGTQTLTLEADEEMTEYYCAVHPDEMSGEIDVEE